MGGDLTRALEIYMPIIGHIQFASAPARAEPDTGEINCAHIFDHRKNQGYTAPLGAEYKPTTTTEAGLGWLKTLV